MRALVVGLVAGVSLLGVGREASAATADGTIITNVASATFNTASLSPYAVSYNATATVIIQNPCVSLVKTPDVTIQAAGGTVTYTLWVVNCSPVTSAFNITMTDKLPDNVAYDAPRGFWNGLGGGLWVSSSSSNGTTWPASNPNAGQTATYYLRFVMPTLGPLQSAYMQYSVKIL